MRGLLFIGYIFIVSQVLCGQSVLDLYDRQELMHGGRILRRSITNPTFAPIPELPEIRHTERFLGRMDSAWDGTRIYQVGNIEGHKKVVVVVDPIITRDGEHRWFFGEPRPLPLNRTDDYLLLGAWEENLLFLQTHRDQNTDPITKKKTEINSQILLRWDLITNQPQSLGMVNKGNDLRSSTIFSKHAFYFFEATGKILRVDVRAEPWSVSEVTSNFWTDANVKLCSDTGQFKNPFIFGNLFLQLDGSILIPAQVFLPLDRDDIDLAWSKLPQSRKAELIASGVWPVPAGKEIGWKDNVCFIKFDPISLDISKVEKSRYKHLIGEEDKNFIINKFKNINSKTLFTTFEDMILELNEAMNRADLNNKKVLNQKINTNASPSNKSIMTPK